MRSNLIKSSWSVNIGSKCFKKASFYLYKGFKLTSTVPWVLLNVENIDGGQGGEGDMRDRGQVIVVQRQPLQLGLTCSGIVSCHTQHQTSHITPWCTIIPYTMTPSSYIPWHHHHTIYHDTNDTMTPWHHDTMAPSYNHTYTMTLWHLDTIKSYSYDRRRDCKLSVKIIVICTLLSLLCVCSFHLKISICSQTAHHDGDMMRSEIHLTWLK